MLGDVSDDRAGGIRVRRVGYGNRESEIGLCVVLELDVRLVPRPDLRVVDGIDYLTAQNRYEPRLQNTRQTGLTEASSVYRETVK